MLVVIVVCVNNFVSVFISWPY